ncbi:tRNA (adenosine(37)-N6)-threonylcarbamoyltransferase complex transferase subunit TsaD, partial [Candidatus Cerribacteria bacterium 'Amazon FNV 2010 28 9']
PLYQQWGGVVPRLARQSHEQHIDQTIELALKHAHIDFSQLDAIAVTQGPGLAITLEVGIAKAKELSKRWNTPLVAVNHMEGHLLSVLANGKQIPFPSLAVLVSGGHTEFVLAKEIGKYEVVGSTQDDAMGEAFDKVGRMLGLGYPAGALIEQFAKRGSPGAVVFPIPMRGVKNANTSFSGLKTAAMRVVEELKVKRGGQLTTQDIYNVALAFQVACITHLREKLQFALERDDVCALTLGGGVAANMQVRKMLRDVARAQGIPCFVPYTKKLCVDNAAMIAIAGFFKAKQSAFVTEEDELDRKPIWSL